MARYPIVQDEGVAPETRGLKLYPVEEDGWATPGGPGYSTNSTLHSASLSPSASRSPSASASASRSPSASQSPSASRSPSSSASPSP